jgi:rare lipoprotein A
MLLLAATPAFAADTHPTASPKPQRGKASVYSKSFHGKKMANGETFSTGSTAAASKTLPLGTKAKVTNLENGKSAEVTIKDRGNLPPGRIVDVSPKTAGQLGITDKKGLAPVKVEP